MAEGGRHVPRARHSLRRRVAFIFTAAVAVTALALALSAYFITKTAQDTEALDKALGQSSFNLLLADAMLPAEPTAADYDRLLDALQIRGDFASLIEAGSETYFSGPQVTRGLVSPELTAKVAEGRIGYQTITMGEEPTLAVGGQVRSSELALYFFYPQGDRLADLARLRNVLIIGGVILAVLGAIAGYWLARRLLGPVRAASKAAALVSQGDLDIRLPVGADEFGVLAASFNQMTENLRAKMLDLEAGQARERRFVADVTHELRTPVAALVGEASLLDARLRTDAAGCPPDVIRLAQLVNTDIARLRQLVDDLLEISRLDAQSAEIVMEPVNLQEFLGQLVRAHGWSDKVALTSVTDAEDRGLTGPAVVISTDKRRVERIIVNLVENALQHGAAPVTIALRQLTAPAQSVQITVTDSGPGIPREHLAHVFDRFYKVDPSRASSRGSGLGLAIARENARLLGGDLRVADSPGGARFALSLPAGPPSL